VLRAAVNRSDRHDNRIERIIFATRNGLPGVDHFRSQHDRVFCLVRVGAVAARAADSDIDRIDIRIGVAFGHANVAGLHVGLVVESEREIWLAESIVKPGLEQRPRAVARLLSWLRHKQDRALPLILQSLQCSRRADERGNMRVVSAGMHHVHIFAFIILRRDFAGIRQTGFLFHRQRVHVGAHEHRGPGAVFHDSDDAVTFEVWIVVFAEMVGDFAARGAQFFRD
jgi:hypothetical protein